jgi:hypothetical protein
MNQTTTQRFTDALAGFSLEPPAGWAVDATGRQGTRVIFLHPVVDRSFQANLNVVVEPLGDMTPDEYLTLCRLQLKRVPAQVTFEQDRPAAEPAGCHLLEYTLVGGPLALGVRQLICTADGKVYVVSATAPRDTFDLYRAAFEASQASFAAGQTGAA